MTKQFKEVPQKDFAGSSIYESDTIRRPGTDTGVVVKLKPTLLTFDEVWAFMAKSIENDRLSLDYKRIAVYEDKAFMGYIDFPNAIDDDEITNKCVESFGANSTWLYIY